MEALKLREGLRVIGRTLREGERPPGSTDHWLNLTTRQHAMKALAHLDRFLAGAANSEINLAHCATRLLLALERFEQERLGAMTPQNLRQLLESRRVR
jgi:hypothetical protein